MPELKWVIILLSIDIVLSPFYRMQEKLLEKRLEFGKLAVINITASLLSGVLAIVAVYESFEVYSLVVLFLVNSITRMIFILWVNRWRPMCYFNLGEVKDMILYAIKYKASAITNYLERNVDSLMIGKLFDAFSLGLYSFAYSILYMPVKRIAYVFSQVLFPTFSLLQNDRVRIASGYLQSIRLIAIVTFPSMVILSLNAEWVILLVFGEQWMAAVDLVRVLCIAGAIQSVAQISGVVYHAVGKPMIPIYLGLFKVAMIIGSILIGSLYGIYHVVLLLLSVNIISFLFNNWLLSKEISIPLHTILNYLMGPTLSALVIVMSHYFFTYYGLINNEIIIGSVSAFIGLIFLLYISYDVMKKLYNDIYARFGVRKK